MLWCYSDASIGHRKLNGFSINQIVDRKNYLSVFSKFGGVAEQVNENLAELGFVGVHD